MYVCCGLENSITGCKADRRVSRGGRRCYRLVWAAMGGVLGTQGRSCIGACHPWLFLPSPPLSTPRQGSVRATQGENLSPTSLPALGGHGERLFLAGTWGLPRVLTSSVVYFVTENLFVREVTRFFSTINGTYVQEDVGSCLLSWVNWGTHWGHWETCLHS